MLINAVVVLEDREDEGGDDSSNEPDDARRRRAHDVADSAPESGHSGAMSIPRPTDRSG